MADRIFLSNDATSSAQSGTENDEEVFILNPVVNETSALANTTVTLAQLTTAKKNGRVVEFWIGTAVGPAVSASGFVSGSLSANLRINSVSCLSTLPAIVGPATSAGAAGRKTTNAGGGVSGVVNAASGVFSAGDQFAVDYVWQSAGSAAAGAAAAGFYVGMTVRYAAR